MAAPAHEEAPPPRRPYVTDVQLVDLRRWAVEQVSTPMQIAGDCQNAVYAVRAAKALEDYVLTGRCPADEPSGGSIGTE